MADLVRYFGTATGRVQGVGFRMYVQQQATELDMTGWVKNMDDGSVTMEIQGSQEAVDQLEQRIVVATVEGLLQARLEPMRHACSPLMTVPKP